MFPIKGPYGTRARNRARGSAKEIDGKLDLEDHVTPELTGFVVIGRGIIISRGTLSLECNLWNQNAHQDAGWQESSDGVHRGIPVKRGRRCLEAAHAAIEATGV